MNDGFNRLRKKSQYSGGAVEERRFSARVKLAESIRASAAVVALP
jgi:hypothetical protein